MTSNSRRSSVADRFWSKVAGGDVTTCWVWSGAINAKTGYGNFLLRKHHNVLPHRYAYEALRAEIPVGLQIDHLCRNRVCVNPWHMEPVTPRVNVRRSANPAAVNAQRTVCTNGHSFDEENTGYDEKRGKRWCRTCSRIRERQYRALQVSPRGGER